MVITLERDGVTYFFHAVSYSFEPGHAGNRYGPADSWEQPEGASVDVSEFKVFIQTSMGNFRDWDFWPTVCEWDQITESIIEYETGE